MRKLLLAVAGWGLLAVYPAYAGPSYCTGTTETVTSGSSVAGSFLLNSSGTSSGNCVEAGDKIFGGFSVNGAITGAGSSSFTFLMTPGNVTLGFQGSVGPNLTGGVDYSVAVDPTISRGFLIDDLEKDFTLNASLTGVAASAVLTGSESVDSFHYSCNRTVNPSGGTCPQEHVFAALVSQITVNQTITTGSNAIVTALTDTISQASSIPEPGSLAMLGSALGIFGFIGWRRREQ